MSAELAALSRRHALLCVAAAPFAVARPAWASPRPNAGGKMAWRIPWSLTSIDPHRIDDVAAAILAPALFDSLYALDDAAGAAVPSLAEALPEATGSKLTVTLRTGLLSGLRRPLTAKDVTRSLSRAAASGAHAWLAEVAPWTVESPLQVSFPGRDPVKLARTLASPVAAILPAGFTPDRPDGTGPFRAAIQGDAVVLSRNDVAANGPAILDQVVVRSAADLASSLSAFESGTDDLGWLGSGLHEPRPGARPFDAGACAWAILRTGALAASWDVPGVAQRICDGIAPSRLAHLAVGAPWPEEADSGWGGAPCELFVRDDCAWLVELARAVAASIGRPSHEVTPRPLPPSELAARRSSRAFALALDVTRPLSPSPLGSLIGLATSDDPVAAADLMRHPPRSESTPRAWCRTLRIGIVGEVRLQGGRAADLNVVSAPGRLDLGSFTRGRSGR